MAEETTTVADTSKPDPATDKTADTTKTADTKTTDTIVTSSTDKPDLPGAADWPADWRDRLAGDDAAFKNILSRYGSPKDFGKAYRELRKTHDSGQVKRVLGKDATPEDIANFRKENGIPETHDGYLAKLPDGLVIGEEDKASVDGFAKAMHAKNAPPELVHEAIAWYNTFKDEQIAAQAERDKVTRAENEDALRAEWGPEFRPNLNIISSFLDTAPAGVKDRFLGARASDGKPLGNDPDTLRWLAGLARESNPAHTVVPGAGANAGKSIADELNALKVKMGDQSSDYWQGPMAEKNQQRYRDLVAAQEKMGAKAA